MGGPAVVPAVAAAAEESTLGFLKDLVKELINPEMIRALSPTEGFEAKPHTFQAVEMEGRWKKPPDWPANDARALVPPAKRVGQVRRHSATVLTIKFKPIDPKWIEAILQVLLQSITLAAAPLPLGTALQLLLQSLGPSSATLATTALPGNFLKPQGPVGKLLPSISRALADLYTPSSAEIEAVWWSDGFEIWAGQAAAKHVRGFGSLFGHQARVELDGASYGNYFPLSYCLTFTGFVNPVGPIFEELRGAVRLEPDGNAKGLFCERSNRDKEDPEPVDFSGTDSGYIFEY